MAEIITKDRKEYNIWDKINGVWNRLNFLTSAKSVDADDGKDLQTKVGAINGISSSSTATDENIAASIGYVNQINTNLGGLNFYEDEDGNKYVVGADSVPKKLGSTDINRLAYATYVGSNGASGTLTYTAQEDINSLILNITAGVYSTHSNSVTITLGDVTGAEVIDQKFEYPTKMYGRHIGYVKFGELKKGTTLTIPISCKYSPSGNTGNVYLMIDLYG